MKTGGRTCAACGERYEPDVLFCPTDGSPLPSGRSMLGSAAEIDPYVGLELAGQIRVEALVGVGAMGRVYRAFQRGVDRHVAVKILHRELSGNAELVERFHREGRIASRLVHPNVVQVLLTGALPTGADARVGGEVYLVMEYLDGLSLLSALHGSGSAANDVGAMPLARSLHVVLQICDAVGAAHDIGVVHRDLKPENVMLVRRGDDPDFVKVLDFGIARFDGPQDANTTQAGLIFGTAKYISPEGADGKPVGFAADSYAIATILYQCLAGVTPFDGDSPTSVLVKQIHEEAPSLTSHPRAAYVPAPLVHLVMRNLSKDPSLRAPDAATLGRSIAAAAREAGIDVDALAAPARGELRLASRERTRQQSHDVAPPAPSTTVLAEPLPEPTEIGREAPRREASAPPVSSPPPSAHRGVSPSRAGWIAGAAALLLVPALAVGAAHVVRSSSEAASPAEEDAVLEATLRDAEGAIRQRAWDAPAGHNVKELTDRALERAPRDGRIGALRRDAAERIVADAVGRKYAGEREEALRLARLALEFAPDLAAAALLVADLERAASPGITPTASAVALGAPRPPLPRAPSSTSRAVASPPPSPPSASPVATPSAAPPPSVSARPQPEPLPTPPARPWL